MEKQLIFIKYVDNLTVLVGISNFMPILLSDEIQNKFCYFEVSNDITCGIAYYDYGVKPDFMMDEDNACLFIGFGKKIICIDIINKKIIFEHELPSIFYEIVSDSHKRYICAVCELDVYCFHSSKLAWKMGFRDIINKYQIEKDYDMKIECENGEEIVMALCNGSVIG